VPRRGAPGPADVPGSPSSLLLMYPSDWGAKQHSRVLSRERHAGSSEDPVLPAATGDAWTFKGSLGGGTASLVVTCGQQGGHKLSTGGRIARAPPSYDTGLFFFLSRVWEAQLRQRGKGYFPHHIASTGAGTLQTTSVQPTKAPTLRTWVITLDTSMFSASVALGSKGPLPFSLGSLDEWLPLERLRAVLPLSISKEELHQPILMVRPQRKYMPSV
jgi:hypothetical protein